MSFRRETTRRPSTVRSPRSSPGWLGRSSGLSSLGARARADPERGPPAVWVRATIDRVWEPPSSSPRPFGRVRRARRRGSPHLDGGCRATRPDEPGPDDPDVDDADDRGAGRELGRHGDREAAHGRRGGHIRAAAVGRFVEPLPRMSPYRPARRPVRGFSTLPRRRPAPRVSSRGPPQRP